MSDRYQAEFLKTKEMLESFEIDLFTAMLNLMMNGELKEWNNGSERGDIINVDGSLLLASEDNNIQILLHLHQELLKSIEHL